MTEQHNEQHNEPVQAGQDAGAAEGDSGDTAGRPAAVGTADTQGTADTEGTADTGSPLVNVPADESDHAAPRLRRAASRPAGPPTALAELPSGTLATTTDSGDLQVVGGLTVGSSGPDTSLDDRRSEPHAGVLEGSDPSSEDLVTVHNPAQAGPQESVPDQEPVVEQRPAEAPDDATAPPADGRSVDRATPAEPVAAPPAQPPVGDAVDHDEPAAEQALSDTERHPAAAPAALPPVYFSPPEYTSSDEWASVATAASPSRPPAVLFQAPPTTVAPRKRHRRAGAPAGPPEHHEPGPDTVQPDVGPAPQPTDAPSSGAGPAQVAPAATGGRRGRRRRGAGDGQPADTGAEVPSGPDSTVEPAAAEAADASAADASATDVSTTEVAAPEVAAPESASHEPAAKLDDADAGDTRAATGHAAAPEQSAQDEPADAEPAGGAEAESEETPRRRRRRGGRGRRTRSRSGGDDSSNGEAGDDEGDEDADLDEERADDSEDGDEASDDTGEQAGQDGAADRDEAGEGAGGTRRRRRRRRRGGNGDDVEPGPDDPPNTVVRMREPRRAQDEVTGLRGSTRLEAKKQRRREGREAGRRRQVITEAEFLARREAVDRMMVVRERDGRTQVAVLEDGLLVEHYVARRTSSAMVGNVYLGRVQNVLPSMEAAFVDIGKGRNAVLYAGEVNWDAAGLEGQPRRIESALKSGDAVLVQVTKEPIGHKGARLTSQISLPGRYLVYVPNSSMTGISRKLPETERGRLKKILRQVLPEDAGVIVRTAAEGASEEELSRDVARLTALWEDVSAKSQAKTNTAPALLYGEPDLAIRVVRDVFNEDFSSLVVSGEEAYETLHEYVRYLAPDLLDRVRRCEPEDDVFAQHRIDEQLAKALDRKVWLPSGGSLVIDRTEAMTVVDVNTGKFTGAGGNLEETVTRNNLEAAEEMVRQLRLRDIGGIIVIDFIDMVLESNRDLVLRRLTECLGRDRTKHQVAEVTSLGLVQMTRKRVGQGLLEVFSEPCAACSGRGIVISDEPVERRGSGGTPWSSPSAVPPSATPSPGPTEAAPSAPAGDGGHGGPDPDSAAPMPAPPRTGTRRARSGRSGSGAAVASVGQVGTGPV